MTHNHVANSAPRTVVRLFSAKPKPVTQIMKTHLSRTPKGLSVFEALVLVAVIAIVAFVFIPLIQHNQEVKRRAKAEAAEKGIKEEPPYQVKGVTN